MRNAFDGGGARVRGLCCAALVLLPLIARSATPIYRSVGPGTTMPLVSGTGQLTVSGALATFTTALPTRVGVGDVIEYDSNGDGLRDTLAFIHARDAAMGGASFIVRAASGAAATPTSAPTVVWAVFRAYTSLDRATRGLENTGIGAAWRDFDTSSEGRDLVAADEEWNIACYADGEDVASAALCNSDNPAGLEGCGMTGNRGWRTDAAHTVRIYTPVSPSEVGVSQRHTGVWGTGYRIGAGLYLYAGFIWADGLSLRQPNTNGRAYLIRPNGIAGRVWLSNSFGWQTCPSCPNMRVFDVWGTGGTGTTLAQVQLWNDVGVADSTGDPNAGVFYLNSDKATSGLFNCTAVARGAGYAFYPRVADVTSAKNCLGVGALADRAFYWGNRWVQIVASAANDDSVRLASLNAMTDFSAGVFPFQTFSFVDAGASDFHLTLTDLGARGRGLNLTADVDRPFNADLDGDPRPAGATAWDIGADQTFQAVLDGGLMDGGVDAGADAGVMVDAGPPDAGSVDAGGVDAGVDAGLMVDAGAPDAGSVDAGGVDAGTVDAGLVDAGLVDAGTVDAGSADGGAMDGGSADGGGRLDAGDFRVGCNCDGTGSGMATLALALYALGRRARQRRSNR